MPCYKVEANIEEDLEGMFAFTSASPYHYSIMGQERKNENEEVS